MSRADYLDSRKVELRALEMGGDDYFYAFVAAINSYGTELKIEDKYKLFMPIVRARTFPYYEVVIAMAFLGFLNLDGPSFIACVMAVMRMADTFNLEILIAQHPDVWKELKARTEAPDGYLPDEIPF